MIQDLAKDNKIKRLQADNNVLKSTIELMETENNILKDENSKLKKELTELQDELEAFYKMKLKDTSVRGSVWYLDSYEQEAIVIQTKFDAYMLLDKETYNRWYDEEFTREEIIGELVKRGWRIKK